MDINFPSLVKSIAKKDMEATIEALTEVDIPSFKDMEHDIGGKPTERWDSEAMRALEWIGLAHLKASRIKKTVKETSSFVSVYQTPSPLLQSDRGVLCKWKGLIPTTVIQHVLTNLR